jgi:uncharacterized phage infection (PIP) family protein YhgE
MTTKALYLLFRIAAVVAPAALLISGCSKSTDSSTVVEQVKADTAQAVVDIRVDLSNSWNSIKDYTYEKRADFSSGMDRMSDKLDEKARALRSKTAGASDAASKDREAAIKDYDDARADLKARMTDLGNATADTWSDAKAKTVAAWNRVRAAYDKAWPDSSS